MMHKIIHFHESRTLVFERISFDLKHTFAVRLEKIITTAQATTEAVTGRWKKDQRLHALPWEDIELEIQYMIRERLKNAHDSCADLKTKDKKFKEEIILKVQVLPSSKVIIEVNDNGGGTYSEKNKEKRNFELKKKLFFGGDAIGLNHIKSSMKFILKQPNKNTITDLRDDGARTSLIIDPHLIKVLP